MDVKDKKINNGPDGREKLIMAQEME